MKKLEAIIRYGAVILLLFVIICLNVLASEETKEKREMSVIDEVSTASDNYDSNGSVIVPSFSSWDIIWPTAKESLEFLSDREYVSTYMIPEAVIYKVDLDVEPTKIVYSFPETGIKTKDYTNRLLYKQVYTDDGYIYTVGSNDIDELLDFLNVELESNLKNFLLMKSDKKNVLEVTDGTIEQECNYDGYLYNFREKKTFLTNLKVDYHKKIADMIESGGLFDDVEGYTKLTDVERKYLEGMVYRINHRDIMLNIAIEVLPERSLNEDEKIEGRDYRIYAITFTETLKDGNLVKLRVEGLDKYHMNRDWFLSVYSKTGFESLRKQDVADILGLGYSELNQLLSTKEDLDKKEDINGLIYYSIYESEKRDNFVGITRVRWNENKRKAGVMSEDAEE